MNFLALVNRARSECGVSGVALASLSGLATEDARIKNWVAEAWHDIQLHKPDWNWMRKPVSFTTVLYGDSRWTRWRLTANSLAAGSVGNSARPGQAGQVTVHRSPRRWIWTRQWWR